MGCVAPGEGERGGIDFLRPTVRRDCHRADLPVLTVSGRLSVKNRARNFIKFREIIWSSIKCNRERERERENGGLTD